MTAKAEALHQIHRIAAHMTYRGGCDHCRAQWAKVARIARDAAADYPQEGPHDGQPR